MIYQKYIKRLLDIIISFVSLIILLPFLVIIALLIKIDSKGKVIFKQERLGKNGKVFKIYKFRTMIENAEKIGTGLSTFEGDPRVTRVGEILRKTSLDEVPQLINVLKGDMSIIGPRPPVPYSPMKYSEYTIVQKQRFEVRPGITGYAQVNGRNSLTWDERIEFDIQYVEKLTFGFDVKILFFTLLKIFSGSDIHGPERRKPKVQKRRKVD